MDNYLQMQIPAVGRGRWQVPVFFLQMVEAMVWQLTVRALLRIYFPSDPANWWYRELVITSVLHTCSTCRWWAQGSDSYQSWFYRVFLLLSPASW